MTGKRQACNCNNWLLVVIFLVSIDNQGKFLYLLCGPSQLLDIVSRKAKYAERMQQPSTFVQYGGVSSYKVPLMRRANCISFALHEGVQTPWRKIQLVFESKS